MTKMSSRGCSCAALVLCKLLLPGLRVTNSGAKCTCSTRADYIAARASEALYKPSARGMEASRSVSPSSARAVAEEAELLGQLLSVATRLVSQNQSVAGECHRKLQEHEAAL